MHVSPLGGDPTPGAVAHALAGRPGLAWLDGGAPPWTEGARSYVASDPVVVVRAEWGEPAPLERLRSLDGAVDAGPQADAPRWIGWIGYDAAWSGATRTPARLPRRADVPVLWLGRYDAVVAFDHRTGEALLVADDDAAAARLRSRIAGDASARPTARVGPVEVEDAEGHGRAIEAALEHIAAGDIYQVNLARRWRAAFEGAPLALWTRMRAASPVPLGLLVDAGDHAVLARTMERFLGWEGPGGDLVSRPIKGTIARDGADADTSARLRADDKERAEHVMIVDLVRNDLGRVAVTGTVEVRERLVVEPYAKLSHLVSTVGCRTRPEVTLADVLLATFPPGSVTGAPKIRAIEIIEALERSARGVYTGCVGFVDRRGGASFAVAIRTAVVSGGEVRYHAGGGLVSASVPAREIAETELKARVFLDAVESLREA